MYYNKSSSFLGNASFSFFSLRADERDLHPFFATGWGRGGGGGVFDVCVVFLACFLSHRQHGGFCSGVRVEGFVLGILKASCGVFGSFVSAASSDDLRFGWVLSRPRRRSCFSSAAAPFFLVGVWCTGRRLDISVFYAYGTLYDISCTSNLQVHARPRSQRFEPCG